MRDPMSEAEPEQENVLILPAAYSQGYAHIRVLHATRPASHAAADALVPALVGQNPSDTAGEQAHECLEEPDDVA